MPWPSPDIKPAAGQLRRTCPLSFASAGISRAPPTRHGPFYLHSFITSLLSGTVDMPSGPLPVHCSVRNSGIAFDIRRRSVWCCRRREDLRYHGKHFAVNVVTEPSERGAWNPTSLEMNIYLGVIYVPSMPWKLRK